MHRLVLSCICISISTNTTACQGCCSEEEFGKPKGFDGALLQNKHFNIGVLESKPFLSFRPNATDSDQNKNFENAKGYIKSLIKYLSHKLGFSYNITRFQLYGKEMPINSGNWTDAFGGIVNKSLDILAVDVMVTPSRALYMDFSGPITYSHQRLFVSLNQSYVAINWTVFLQPFTWPVWIILLADMFLAVMCLRAAISVAPVPQRNAKEKPSWISIGFDVWGIFIQQDAADIPRDFPSISTKIILSVISLMSMIAFTCYSSILISATTVAQQPWIVKTVSDVLARSDYKIGLQKDSTFIDVLQRSNSGIYRNIWERVQKYNTANVESFVPAMKMMDEDNFAYVNTEYKFTAMANGSCKYTVLKDKLYRQSVHFAFQKGSNITKIFTATLNKMRQCGILDKMEANHGLTLKSTNCTGAHSTTTMQPVELSSMASTFVALLIGIPLAFVLLFIENCVKSYKY